MLDIPLHIQVTFNLLEDHLLKSGHRITQRKKSHLSYYSPQYGQLTIKWDRHSLWDYPQDLAPLVESLIAKSQQIMSV